MRPTNEELEKLKQRAVESFAKSGHPLHLLRASHWSLALKQLHESRRLLYQCAAANLSIGDPRTDESAVWCYRKLDAGYGALDLGPVVTECAVRLSRSRCYICTGAAPAWAAGASVRLCESCIVVARRLVERPVVSGVGLRAFVEICEHSSVLGECDACGAEETSVVRSRLGSCCFACIRAASRPGHEIAVDPVESSSRDGLPEGVLGGIEILYLPGCLAVVASFWQERDGMKQWQLYCRHSDHEQFEPLNPAAERSAVPDLNDQPGSEESLECPLGTPSGHVFFLRCSYRDRNGLFHGRQIAGLGRYDATTRSFDTISLPKTAWPIGAVVGASTTGDRVYLTGGASGPDARLEFHVVEVEWVTAEVRVLQTVPTILLG